MKFSSNALEADLAATACQNFDHSIVVKGSTPLKGCSIAIPDLRAGFAYVMAALVALAKVRSLMSISLTVDMVNLSPNYKLWEHKLNHSNKTRCHSDRAILPKATPAPKKEKLKL